jgi:hypothetical protein
MVAMGYILEDHFVTVSRGWGKRFEGGNWKMGWRVVRIRFADKPKVNIGNNKVDSL